MSGFTKLYSEITDSSIWNEADKTRIVWITLLARMGPDGIVRASVGGLAHLARVPRAATEKALKILESPDEDSRSPEFEGRRVERVQGGFLILNGGKYREARSVDERREYMRKYMREYRARKHGKPNSKTELASLAQAEAEAEAEEESEAKAKNEAPTSPLPPTKRVAWSEEDGFTGLIDKDFERLAKANPAVDIQGETLRASEWLTSNPRKRKKQPYRFLSAWLSRCQEKGGSRTTFTPPSLQEAVEAELAPPDITRAWHASRSAIGWKRGREQIQNWRADLTAYISNRKNGGFK